MSNVVAFRRADPLIFICAEPCGNKSFMLYDDGGIECTACGRDQTNTLLHLYPRRKDYSTVVTTYPQENGMAKVNIVAPRRYAVHVVVYEPRQTPEQAEVILDEFDLKAGEAREDYELRSATAAYRVERIEDHATIRELETEENMKRLDNPFAGLTDGQEPGPDGLNPTANAEIEAGREAHERNQRAPEGNNEGPKPKAKKKTAKTNDEK